MEDYVQNFRFIFDTIDCGAFFQNADGTITDVNAAALTIFGLSRDEFLAGTFFQSEWRVTSEDGTLLPSEQYPSMAALRSGEPVSNFIAGVYNPLCQDFRWLRINATPMFHGGETLPHTVFVTFSDITAHCHVENMLLASEARYRSIVNSQTDFVDRFLPGGLLTFVNDALCRYCGISREELLGKSFFQFIHNDDLPQQIQDLETLTQEDPSIESVCRIVHPDGTIRWHHWTNTAIFDNDGSISEYQSVGRDITAQKLAEQARNEYAAQLKIALETANAGTWDWDIVSGQQSWADEFFSLFGLNPLEHEASCATWLSRVHPDDSECAHRRIQTAIETRYDLNDDFRILMPDGTVRWINVHGRTIYDQAGKPQRMSGICLDITSRKIQEDLLQQSERLAAAILNASTEPIMLIDSDGIILMTNSAMLQRLGKRDGELLGTNIFSQLPDDVSAFRRSKLDEAISLRRPVRFEDTREGRIIDSHVYPIIDADGVVTTAAVFSRDITDNKKNLDQLNYVNECFSQALYGAQHHILYRLNVRAGCYDYLSPAFETITGHPLGEFKLLNLEQLKGYFHPDDRDLVFATIDEAVQTRTADTVSCELEYRLRKADGSYCWLHDSTIASLNDKGEPELFFGSAYDITERKRIETMLSASEERFRSLMELSPDIISIITKEGVLTYNSPAAQAIHGYADEELVGRNTFDLIHPDDQALVSATIQTLLADPLHSVSVQYRYRNKDGTYNWMEAMSSNHSNNPNIGGLIVISRDIAERKQMEIDLRASEERYRRFIATANEGIGISDRDYIITYVNNYFADMLGYKAEELLGVHVPSLLHDSELAQFNANVAACQNGISGCHEYLYCRKNGSTIWLLTSSTPIIDSSGAFQGLFSMFSDLSDRKNAEKSLLQAKDELELRVQERMADLETANEQIKQMSFQLIQAEEQERSRIAAELHDHVGQSLLLAKIKLDILVADSPSAEQSREAETVSLIIENAIHDIRTLTFGMRPPLLDTGGLEPALEWLCPQLYKDYGLQVAFRRHDQSYFLPAEQLYPVFQAVRELLLNVAKHAGVDRAELSIKEETDRLVIQVADHGSGFSYDPNQANFGSTGGFGLYNVQRRIAQLGGQTVITTSTDGTVVTLAIPLQLH